MNIKQNANFPFSRYTTLMLPEFPDFKNIEITDKEEIENFTKNYPPYSDFNFVSLFCWDVDNKRKISMLNGNLVVRSSDDVTGKEFLTFLGTNKVPETVKELLKFCRKNKIKQELRMIPEETIKLINPKELGVDVKEDRDQFDYVYSIDSLSSYPNSEYSRVKKKYNKFLKKYDNNYKVEEFNLGDSICKEQITKLWKEWCEDKAVFSEEEGVALERLMKNEDSFKLINIIVFIGRAPAGFFMGAGVNREYAVGYFSKTSHIYEGITQALMKEVASVLKKRGYAFFNYEEDMGLPGLRQAKESFRPVSFLKKYTIIHNGVLQKLFMLYN